MFLVIFRSLYDILCFIIMAHPKLMKQKVLSSLEGGVDFKGHFPLVHLFMLCDWIKPIS